MGHPAPHLNTFFILGHRSFKEDNVIIKNDPSKRL